MPQSNAHLVAVIRISEHGAAAWVEQGNQFVRPLGCADTLAKLHDRLIADGFSEANVYVENCLFPDSERSQSCVPRYRFVHYHGANGAGAGRHLVRVN